MLAGRLEEREGNLKCVRAAQSHNGPPSATGSRRKSHNGVFNVGRHWLHVTFCGEPGSDRRKELIVVARTSDRLRSRLAGCLGLILLIFLLLRGLLLTTDRCIFLRLFEDLFPPFSDAPKPHPKKPALQDAVAGFRSGSWSQGRLRSSRAGAPTRTRAGWRQLAFWQQFALRQAP